MRWVWAEVKKGLAEASAAADPARDIDSCDP
jgi:hypothetical protein